MYKSKCKWPLLSRLVTFLIATTEYMTEDSLGEEGVISFTYWGDMQSIPAEKAWPQFEAGGLNMSSSVEAERQEKELDCRTSRLASSKLLFQFP